jgi:hypothetical protein
MSATQRLLIGFVIGGFLTLLILPAPRASVLHLLHGRAVRETLAASPTTRPGGPLEEPAAEGSLSLSDARKQMLLIAQRAKLAPDAPFSARDFRLAMETVARGSELDPDNAYWPQIEAALATRAGRAGLAREPFARALDKARWSSGATETSARLWKDLERATGSRSSWQGFLAASYRVDAPADLIVDLGVQLPRTSADADSDWIARATYVRNMRVLLSGVRSFPMADAATKRALAVVSLAGGETENQTPLTREQARARFEAKVEEAAGKEFADRTRRAIAELSAWRSTNLPHGDIEATRESSIIQSVLAAAVPSMFLVTGLFLAGMAAVGWMLRTLFRRVPHPDTRIIFGFAFLLALVIGVLTSAWPVVVWIIFLGLLCMIPVEVVSEAPVEWSLLNRMVIGGITSVTFISASLWLFASGPSALLAERALSYANRLPLLADRALLVTICAATFVIPCAVVWAHIKRQPLLFMIGETIVRVGVAGAVVGTFGAIVSTPIAAYVDSELRSVAEAWIVNESDAFKVALPR